MEWRYGSTDFQERFSADYIRAVNLGLQGGFYPTVLDGIQGTPEQKEWISRTMLACILPNEVVASCGIGINRPLYRQVMQILWDFGRAEPDTTFLPYWDKATPIRPTQGNLVVSGYLRNDRLMLVAGNYGGDGTVPIALDVRKLGFAEIASARNVETDAELAVLGEKVMLPIKKHDLALVEVTLAGRR